MHELPRQFEFLRPYDKWVESDDALRSEIAESTSDEELKMFVEAVAPHFEAINTYLDGHTDEAACNLGAIAEAACEAQWDLERRKADA